jgi:hypothetical protein
MPAIRTHVACREPGNAQSLSAQHARNDMRKEQIAEVVSIEGAEQYRRRG